MKADNPSSLKIGFHFKPLKKFITNIWYNMMINDVYQKILLQIGYFYIKLEYNTIYYNLYPIYRNIGRYCYCFLYLQSILMMLLKNIYVDLCFCNILCPKENAQFFDKSTDSFNGSTDLKLFLLIYVYNILDKKWVKRFKLPVHQRHKQQSNQIDHLLSLTYWQCEPCSERMPNTQRSSPVVPFRQIWYSYFALPVHILTAKASCTSHTSISLTLKPAFSNTLGVAYVGPSLRPNCLAFSSVIMRQADAPSFAAVTVPCGLTKAAFNFANLSIGDTLIPLSFSITLDEFERSFNLSNGVLALFALKSRLLILRECLIGTSDMNSTPPATITSYAPAAIRPIPVVIP
ncbi:hypothetical protein AGLY_005984 [Aphis glycines]|uniref:Uncharacterized protein n=1 Tax=Aphis glycines TaxID=307491 RepID=A0A6G0TUS2_APHGL|nr:hypothetical protein AGLY_005984 [Aphis glycines]